MPHMLLPAQIRGARGMLDWSILDLAQAAQVSVSTVKRVEEMDTQPVSDDTRSKIQGALERAGVRFLDDVGEGTGLRVRPRQDRRPSPDPVAVDGYIGS